MIFIRCHKIRFLPLVIVLLAVCSMVSVPAAAEYLLDTAHQFHLGGQEVLKVATPDLNGDGIPDLAGLCELYEDGPDDAIVARLGNGDGTFGEPVVTLVGGDRHYYLCFALIDDDLYADLVLHKDFDPIAVKIFLGNGDGSFSFQTSYPDYYRGW